jgi:hypothetical protein
VTSKAGKLVLMEAAEQERRDSMVAARLLTPMQRAARDRREGALARIRAFPPRDAEVGEAGIERAREALEEAACRRRVDGVRQLRGPHRD